mmetsp:Transcript_67055/g.82144  ORF Transcript_67055/g.82144 Transcript_67055/m.82144 type:complete len:192 (-) Transcript_67055:154-729(-)
MSKLSEFEDIIKDVDRVSTNALRVYPCIASLAGFLLLRKDNNLLDIIKHCVCMTVCIRITGNLQLLCNASNMVMDVKKVGRNRQDFVGASIEQKNQLINYNLDDNFHTCMIMATSYNIFICYYLNRFVNPYINTKKQNKTNKNGKSDGIIKWIKRNKFYILSISPIVYAFCMAVYNDNDVWDNYGCKKNNI